jgi:hypothetical protein
MTRASVASAALLSCLVAAVPAAAQVTRVSVSTAGAEANGGSVHPSISRDGRFVVFSSLASNLVADDTNGVEDVFLRDRDTDADGVFDEPGAVATTRLSVGSGGVELTGASSEPVITPDGRFVAFTSTAPNLIAGNSGVAQVYRLDRTTSTLIRISERVDGAAGNAASASPVISDDGDVVAFASDAQNLSDAVPPVEQYLTTNYVRKVSDDTTTRLFIDDGRFPPFATLTNYFQRPPTITGDGRLVTFTEIVVFLGHAAAPGAYIVDLSANNTAIPIKGGGQKMLSADGSALAIGGQGAALEGHDGSAGGRDWCGNHSRPLAEHLSEHVGHPGSGLADGAARNDRHRAPVRFGARARHSAGLLPQHSRQQSFAERGPAERRLQRRRALARHRVV